MAVIGALSGRIATWFIGRYASKNNWNDRAI